MTSAQPDSEIATAAAEPGRATFRRVLLKLSGEALMGDQPYGVEPARVEAIAREVTRVRRDGVETALVIGAGNIHRGLEAVAEGMDRATADYAGMLATVLNCLTMQDALAGKQLERAPYRVWVLCGDSEMAPSAARRTASAATTRTDVSTPPSRRR